MNNRERKLIVVVLEERDGCNCHYCGKKLQTKTKAKRLPTNYAQVEHKLARARGGSDDEDNLVLACKDCNRRKGNRKYDEFISTELQLAKTKYETLLMRENDG